MFLSFYFFYFKVWNCKIIVDKKNSCFKICVVFLLFYLYDKLKYINVICYWFGIICILDVIFDDLFYIRVFVLLKLRVCFL